MAKFAPRFVTSEQQDAQEFLGFVMDGIHEDLNRVSMHIAINLLLLINKSVHLAHDMSH